MGPNIQTSSSRRGRNPRRGATRQTVRSKGTGNNSKTARSTQTGTRADVAGTTTSGTRRGGRPPARSAPDAADPRTPAAPSAERRSGSAPRGRRRSGQFARFSATAGLSPARQCVAARASSTMGQASSSRRACDWPLPRLTGIAKHKAFLPIVRLFRRCRTCRTAGWRCVRGTRCHLTTPCVTRAVAVKQRLLLNWSRALRRCRTPSIARSSRRGCPIAVDFRNDDAPF
jgi:hypothetical protein